MLLAGLATGTFSDRAAPHREIFLGGYRVLSADLHLHAFPMSASTLTPWDLMWDAYHNGVDVVAIAGHNEVWSGQAAHWMARHFGGPTVLASQEIHGPAFHLIALAIIPPSVGACPPPGRSARSTGRADWPSPRTPRPRPGRRMTKRRCNCSMGPKEVLQPIAYVAEPPANELRAFYARNPWRQLPLRTGTAWGRRVPQKLYS